MRFLLQVLKLHLLPILALAPVEGEDGAGDEGGEAATGPAMMQRVGLRQTILELVLRLLEHDQCAGAHLVTPVLQVRVWCRRVLDHFYNV